MRVEEIRRDANMSGHVTISRQMQQRMTPFILFVWVLTCAIWSTVWLFIKLGVRDVPPAAFAVYRMAIALAVVVPVIVLRRTPCTAQPASHFCSWRSAPAPSCGPSRPSRFHFFIGSTIKSST